MYSAGYPGILTVPSIYLYPNSILEFESGHIDLNVTRGLKTGAISDIMQMIYQPQSLVETQVLKGNPTT